MVKAYSDMGARDTTTRRGELGAKSFFQFFFGNGRLQAFISMNRPVGEVNLAKSILHRHPTLERLRSISDESRSSQDFMVG